MRIPKVVGFNGREYIFVREYPNFIMYQDMITKTKICFSRQQLGMVKTKKKASSNINPEKVKI